MSIASTHEDARTLYREHRFDEAFQSFLALAENDDAESQQIVGSMLLRGEGVPKNLIEARRWLTSAANKENDEAWFYLAELNEIEGKWDDASFCYQKSSSLGNPAASFRLAVFWRRCPSMQRDHAEMIKWLTRSAAQGHVFAKAGLVGHMWKRWIPGGRLLAIRELFRTFAYGIKSVLTVHKEDNPANDKRFRK